MGRILPGNIPAVLCNVRIIQSDFLSFLLEQRFHFYLKWTLFGIYMTKEAIIISQFSKKKKDKRKRVISINTGSESCLFQLFLLLSRFNVPLPPFV